MSLLHGCSSVAPAWLCAHADILLYLAPSAALAFLIWMVSNAHPFFFVFTVAGTLCHELAHFSVGLLTNAEPTGLTIIPRRRGKLWELGSVTFANLRWYNAAPAALAPVLVLLVPLAFAWWRTRGGLQFGPVDLALTFVLAPQFLSFWPSPVDWRLALRSWPYLIVIIIALGILFWLQPSLFRFVKT
ncbi:hypothetical protein [Massilia horti]|uniref:Uncharacterized protein n=1 Tax=Massilia horti TaxID=2562153 RepID=A0A4Y9T265_9BURK|nr:hypothetical protein [Massilia horti]TFW30997.1 hypothetical protein E4O92_14915 [Massilia horti]